MQVPRGCGIGVESGETVRMPRWNLLAFMGNQRLQGQSLAGEVDDDSLYSAEYKSHMAFATQRRPH
jgi:hypothetical protein